jgi:hypothetical protein
MKILNFQTIDGYEILFSVSNPPVDPAATEARIKSILSDSRIPVKSKEELYSENVVFARCGPSQRLVNDAEGDDFQTALDGLTDHEKLLSSGEKIPDWRNIEFWIKGQKWEKIKIEKLGEPVPQGGVLEEDLNNSQRDEIAADIESERVSGLTPEQKTTEEKNRRIAILKRKLAETDYIAAKIAEGVATVEEYADKIAQRQAWRQEINTLSTE